MVPKFIPSFAVTSAASLQGMPTWDSIHSISIMMFCAIALSVEDKIMFILSWRVFDCPDCRACTALRLSVNMTTFGILFWSIHTKEYCMVISSLVKKDRWGLVLIGKYISCTGTTNAAPSIFCQGLSTVRVYMGFLRVFFVNELQADPVHVVSLVFFFFFAAHYGFQFTGR